MEPATLAEIKDEIDRRCTEDFARPNIEVDSSGCHYVVVERGNELERVTTQHLDELLFHVFAGEYEIRHRRTKEDCRRKIFPCQIEPLARLAPAWAKRTARHYQEVGRF